jgi:hypothetical protein
MTGFLPFEYQFGTHMFNERPKTGLSKIVTIGFPDKYGA